LEGTRDPDLEQSDQCQHSQRVNRENKTEVNHCLFTFAFPLQHILMNFRISNKNDTCTTRMHEMKVSSLIYWTNVQSLNLQLKNTNFGLEIELMVEQVPDMMAT
jgi:hypothetical protein